MYSVKVNKRPFVVILRNILQHKFSIQYKNGFLLKWHLLLLSFDFSALNLVCISYSRTTPELLETATTLHSKEWKELWMGLRLGSHLWYFDVLIHFRKGVMTSWSCRTLLGLGQFLGSMLPQYMALSVTFRDFCYKQQNQTTKNENGRLE